MTDEGSRPAWYTEDDWTAYRSLLVRFPGLSGTAEVGFRYVAESQSFEDLCGRLLLPEEVGDEPWFAHVRSPTPGWISARLYFRLLRALDYRGVFDVFVSHTRDAAPEDWARYLRDTCCSREREVLEFLCAHARYAHSRWAEARKW